MKKRKITIEVSESNYCELVNIKEIAEEQTGISFGTLEEFLTLGFEASFENFDIPHDWLRYIFT